MYHAHKHKASDTESLSYTKGMGEGAPSCGVM